MKIWLLWVMMLDSTTGELISDAAMPGYKPATMEQCVTDSVGRVSHPDKDGAIAFFYCSKMDVQ